MYISIYIFLVLFTVVTLKYVYSVQFMDLKNNNFHILTTLLQYLSKWFRKKYISKNFIRAVMVAIIAKNSYIYRIHV